MHHHLLYYCLTQYLWPHAGAIVPSEACRGVPAAASSGTACSALYARSAGLIVPAVAVILQVLPLSVLSPRNSSSYYPAQHCITARPHSGGNLHAHHVSVRRSSSSTMLTTTNACVAIKLCPRPRPPPPPRYFCALLTTTTTIISCPRNAVAITAHGFTGGVPPGAKARLSSVPACFVLRNPRCCAAPTSGATTRALGRCFLRSQHKSVSSAVCCSTAAPQQHSSMRALALMTAPSRPANGPLFFQSACLRAAYRWRQC